MLRYHIRALARILSQPNASCSTAVKSDNDLPLVHRLSQEFADIGNISRALKETDVKYIPFNEWKSRICVMKSYMFTDKECFQMISKYNNLLKIPLHNFESTLDQWYNSNLGIENFQTVLKTKPELIDINVSEIPKRIPQLRFFFKSSHSVAKVLMDCPNVMRDNWLNVLSKLDYLSKIKRLPPQEILESGALSIPMDFIKFRIELLEKCGIFKQEHRPIHKINKMDKTAHRNPPLTHILSDTEDFIKVAKISSEEYYVCKDLFMSNEDDGGVEDLEEINTFKMK